MKQLLNLLKTNGKKLGVAVPIIATGHLPVAGGKRNDDDGVRETYIGNIEAVGNDIFPDAFDYVALGHYHIPSFIKDHIRFCGSPIPMGFGEAGQKKYVTLLNSMTGETSKPLKFLFSEIGIHRRRQKIHRPTFVGIEKNRCLCLGGSDLHRE